MIGWALTIIISILAITLARSSVLRRGSKGPADLEEWQAFIQRGESAAGQQPFELQDMSEAGADTRARIGAFSWGNVMLTIAVCVGTALIASAEDWHLIAFATVLLSSNLRDDFGSTFSGFMRRSMRRRGDIAVYVVAAAVKIGLTGSGVWLLFRAAAMFNSWSVLAGLGLLGAALAILALAHIPPSWLIQIGVLRRRHNEELMVDRDSILLLRSFDNDAVRMTTPAGGGGILGTVLPLAVQSLEKLLTLGIAPRQVVAIGKPGEMLPPLGAVRTYWADDEWQGAIQRAANQCRMIVILGGTSGGLTWELNQVTSWGLMGKTVVLLPPTKEVEPAARLKYVIAALGTDPEAQQTWPAEGSEDEMLLGAASIAVRAMPGGALRYYVTTKHDWAGYVAALHQFIREFEQRTSEDSEAPDEAAQAWAREPVPNRKQFWSQTRPLATGDDGLFADPVKAQKAAAELLQILNPQASPGTVAAIQTLSIRADLQSHKVHSGAFPTASTWLHERHEAALDAARLAGKAQYGASIFGSSFTESYGSVAGGLNIPWAPARVQLEATQTAYEIAQMLADPNAQRRSAKIGVGFAARQSDPIVECTWRNRLAEASLRIGDLSVAEQEVKRTQALAQQSGDVLSLYQATRLEAELYELREDEGAAEETRQRSESLREQLGIRDGGVASSPRPIPFGYH